MLQPASAYSRSPDCRVWRPLAIGVFLLLLGVRWAVLAAYGSAVPYWDEWSADAELLFRPWVRGEFSWSTFLSLHNEHRIVLTRGWELGFFVLNAQRWDPQLVQTANAAVAALAAAVLVYFVGTAPSSREFGSSRQARLAPGLAVLVVPFGYSNLLIAFQSQFAFLQLLSLAALGLWSRAHVTNKGVTAGLACAAIALFSVGGGLLTAVALAALALVRAWQEPMRRGFWLRALAGSAVVVVAGALLGAAAEAPYTWAAMLTAVGRYASWPVGNLLAIVTDWPDSARYLPPVAGTWPSPETAWLPALARFLQNSPRWAAGFYVVWGLVLYAPLFAHFVSLRRPGAARSWLLAALGLWSLLNVGAMAIARAEYSVVPPRYQDILAVGLLANGLVCLRALTAAREERGNLRRWLATAWLLLAGLSLAITAYGIFRLQLPRKAEENRAAANLIQEYLVSGDANLFLNRPPNHVPWPGQEERLAELLRDPVTRGFLPIEILPVAERSPAPFASRIALLLRASGLWVALAGVVWLLFGLMSTRARTDTARPV